MLWFQISEGGRKFKTKQMKKKTSFGMNADLSMKTVSSVKTTQAFEWVFDNHDK